MSTFRRTPLATLAAALSAGGLIAALSGVAPAAAASSNAAVHRPAASNCYPAQLNGSGGFLGSFTTVCQIASTVPAKGDVNPYGVAVVPKTVGDLVAGDVLVSNFNNSNNLQGTGTTIMQVSPSGTATVFADLTGQTHNHVGLTTALAVFRDGDVVVGSLPTTNGMAATARAGALYVLNSQGTLIETINGADQRTVGPRRLRRRRLRGSLRHQRPQRHGGRRGRSGRQGQRGADRARPHNLATRRVATGRHRLRFRGEDRPQRAGHRTDRSGRRPQRHCLRRRHPCQPHRRHPRRNVPHQ